MKKVIIMLASLAIILCGCAAEIAPAPELLTPVGSLMDTTAAEMGVIEEVEVYEAAVTPEYHELYFTHDARIGNIPVMLGDEVKKGDVLIEMDISAINSAIAALESERDSLVSAGEYAKAIYDIDMEIFALELKKLSGDAAYDMETDMAIYEMEYQNECETRAERLAAIGAEIEELALNLEDTSLVSPCDGRVTYITTSRNSTVGAYDTVCVVTDDNSLTLKSDFIAPAIISTAAEMYAVMDGERFEITPLQINEDEYSRAALRKVSYLTDFDAELPEGAKAGDTCVVYVVAWRTEDVLRVPANSVFNENDEYYVYLMDGSSRIKTSVGVGVTNYIYTEITSGIEEGDVVYVGD